MRGASSFVSRDQQTLPLSAHFTVELWMTIDSPANIGQKSQFLPQLEIPSENCYKIRFGKATL